MNTWISSFIVSEETEGFGLNSDILETNIINIIILIALLVYVLGNFLKENLTLRQTYIVNAIQECEKRLNEANARLQEAESQWIQTQISLKQITSQIKQSTMSLAQSANSQAHQDLLQYYSNCVMILKYRQQEVFFDIKKQVSQLALNQVKVKLQSQLNKADQALIIENAINRLGGVIYDQ